MHGMLSLAVLVAAFAGLAGWIGYLLVRLYLACPAARSTAALSLAAVQVAPGRPALTAGPSGPSSAGDPSAPPLRSVPASDQAGTPKPDS